MSRVHGASFIILRCFMPFCRHATWAHAKPKQNVSCALCVSFSRCSALYRMAVCCRWCWWWWWWCARWQEAAVSAAQIEERQQPFVAIWNNKQRMQYRWTVEWIFSSTHTHMMQDAHQMDMLGGRQWSCVFVFVDGRVAWRFHSPANDWFSIERCALWPIVCAFHVWHFLFHVQFCLDWRNHGIDSLI